MAQRQVAVGIGPDYTSIRATIPCHYMKVWEDGERAHDLEYTLPDDGFLTVYRTKDLYDVIELIGHGRAGPIGRPAGYCAENVPALGDIVMKIRAQDASAITINVYESVSEL